MTERLSKDTVLRTLKGVHLDEALQLAARNGFAVNVAYTGAIRSAGRKVLTIKVDAANCVTHAR